MSSKVLVATLACVLPCIASAQQTGAQQNGVQAQGQASAQGGASVEHGNGTAVQSQSTAGGNASGSVSHADKSASADGGATTNAILSGSLDAQKSKPGDPVTAKTAEPTTTPDHVVLPRGTKLLGHVTEAQAAGSGEGQSTLGIVFDRAVLKDGREVPLQTTVRALAAAESAANVAGDSPAGLGADRRGMGSNPGGGVVGGLGSQTSGAVGGAVGGLGSQTGGAVGGAGRITGNAAGSVASTMGGSSRALEGGAGAVGGLNARGMLSSESQGVFGMRGMNLTQHASGSGSVVTSAGRSVHLESGTRMLLAVQSGVAQGTSAAQGAGSASGAAQGGASHTGSGQPPTPSKPKS